MLRRTCAAAALVVMLFASGPSFGEEPTTVVFAAASLNEALTDVVAAYAAAGNPKPEVSFGASSLLAKQIENGAPADLFLSADEQWMEYLVGRGLVVLGTRTDFVGNQLVIVAPAVRPFRLTIEPGFPLAATLGDDKLAMADPDSVPAGRYGKTALTNLGVWTAVEKNVVRAQDVRGALMLVERDEARAGIVYSTDALESRNVVVAGIFPEASHEPIVYPLAIVAGHDRPEVRRLREFILSAAAKSIFERHGFVPK